MAVAATGLTCPAVTPFQIRPRTDDDLPALAGLLERQQERTKYPFVWPFPAPVEQFLKRDTELHAWVADVDGTVAGQVAITSVTDDEDPISRSWATAHGVPMSELRCISAFFADIDRAGSGIGSGLLATATKVALAEGYPVLDVVAAHETPVQLYLRRGWRIIETTDAPWHPGIKIPIYLMMLPRATDA